jgi:hypothetical protein
MSISKTTKRTKRKSPASDIAASKAEAQRDGLRRYLTKACPECHHRVRLLPTGDCERCWLVTVLDVEHDDEDGAAEERKRARNHMAATQRGPAAYAVDILAYSKKDQAGEDALQAGIAKSKARAEGALGLFLACLEDDPELLRRAIMWAPGMSHPWSRQMIELLQDVFVFVDLKEHVDLYDVTDDSVTQFLLGHTWDPSWVTPSQYEQARGRAEEVEEHHEEWLPIPFSRGGRDDKCYRGPGLALSRIYYAAEDQELVARYHRERQQRLEMQDTVYRADLRRWERGIDQIDRDHPDYQRALDMKPKAPEGFYGRVERRKAAKAWPKKLAALQRRAQQRRMVSRVVH